MHHKTITKPATTVPTPRFTAAEISRRGVNTRAIAPDMAWSSAADEVVIDHVLRFHIDLDAAEAFPDVECRAQRLVDLSWRSSCAEEGHVLVFVEIFDAAESFGEHFG